MNGFCDSSKPSSTLVGRERTWRGDAQALVVGLVDLGQQLRASRRAGRRTAAGVMVIGRPDSAARRRNRPNSPVLVVEVGDDLHPAGAGLAHGVGDGRQLGLLGAQGRDVLPSAAR